MKEMGVAGRFIVYPGMEHSTSNQELRDMIEFIERKLPPAKPTKAKL